MLKVKRRRHPASERRRPPMARMGAKNDTPNDRRHAKIAILEMAFALFYPAALSDISAGQCKLAP
jgi:hypothetical protein